MHPETPPSDSAAQSGRRPHPPDTGPAIRPAVALILDLDPDLGRGIPPQEWHQARDACRGPILTAEGALMDRLATASRAPGLLGLLVANGVVCREVNLGGRVLFELLGQGDILLPPETEPDVGLGAQVTLTGVGTVQLVALQHAYLAAGARWPGLLRQMFDRLEAQRQRLAVQALIVHLPRAEHRLLLAMRHLADQWGQVTPRGTVIPLPLTHDILADLIGARRSTVTTAIAHLRRTEVLEPLDAAGWLLRPKADPAIGAISQRRDSQRVVGEILRLRTTTVQRRRGPRALRLP